MWLLLFDVYYFLLYILVFDVYHFLLYKYINYFHRYFLYEDKVVGLHTQSLKCFEKQFRIRFCQCVLLKYLTRVSALIPIIPYFVIDHSHVFQIYTTFQ